MLTVLLRKDDRTKMLVMHVGETFQYQPSDVFEVQADGDELTEIVGQTTNIPIGGSVTTWYGDTARFIMANVRFETPRYGKYRARK